MHISLNGIYAVIIGFLCGFPMGAKTVAELYSCKKLSRQEASYLLAFCNNIGPVYFIGFVLPTLGLPTFGLGQKTPYLFGMYGLPLLYGIFLRYTVYRGKIAVLHPAPGTASPLSLLDTLDDAILSGLYSISKLGGYMILFNLLNLVPHIFLKPVPITGTDSSSLINCLLEITSGISRVGDAAPLPVLLLLPFGGFSCIAQTYSMIKETDLSLRDYLFHKLVLTMLTAVYYGLWALLFPSAFPL